MRTFVRMAIVVEVDIDPDDFDPDVIEGCKEEVRRYVEGVEGEVTNSSMVMFIGEACREK